ncbi:hypothetical protein AB0H76_15095 [Nocardia sp. NPDC050712]|uniref:hypothetical protein n=1 Tax=Nocardia sp. NPDC050712 TaxID=3155518 RepID=UPI0033C7AF3E
MTTIGSADLDAVTGPMKHITAEERERAALTVCHYATDTADAAELLAMLGLAEPKPAPIPPAPTTPRFARNGPARRHIISLRDAHDISLARIALAAGLRNHTVGEILRSETSLQSTVDAILAVTVEDCAPPIVECECGATFARRANGNQRCTHCLLGQVPVGPAREHVKLLRARLTLKQIRAMSGFSEDTIRRIGSPDVHLARTHIAPETEARILALEIPGATT